MSAPSALHYYLWSIGCQMNAADAARLAEGLVARGLRPTRDPAEAGVLVLNTCVVRQSAEDKVIGRLNSLRPLKSVPDARLLLVMGCFVGDARELAARYPFVDAYLPPSDIAGALAAVDGWLAERGACGTVAPTEGAPVGVSDGVPVSYGCDHHCTYCIVALRRGPQRSRSVAEIVADVERLAARGVREVTLLGQNVDAYGADLEGQPDLADVLRAVHAVEGLWRIRFLTSHPADMTSRLIQTVAELPKVCPSWELAAQSGDDTVLRRMGRGYGAARVRALVAEIRATTRHGAAMPECAINTDIIVGFPSETAAQFANTLRLLEELRFDMVHVAAYSTRPGTAAAAWPDDVPAAEKQGRRAAVEALQERIAGELNGALLGQTLEILVDGQAKGRWRGRTRTNKLVFFESAEDWLGQLAPVRITWAGPWSMLGKVMGEADLSPRAVLGDRCGAPAGPRP
ncbi:MAG: MiaB/RimO family radical SAM methylthiotransferase [Chloroflexota bacterium]